MDQYSKMHNDSLGKVILLAIFFLVFRQQFFYILKKIMRNILTTFCYFTQEDAIN